MFNLATTLKAAVERDPQRLAVVSGTTRMNYAQWGAVIDRVASGLINLGLSRGDHVVVVNQNRWQMAAMHFACQLTGIIVTPINWRAKAADIDYVIDDCHARAVMFEAASEAAVRASSKASGLINIAVECEAQSSVTFNELSDTTAHLSSRTIDASDTSLMLYTSGTTGRPKGVPRSQRVERIAALAHVAQNQYGYGEVTLGVMPLYHTMGVRSLLAMTLINGTFVCLPKFDAAQTLTLIDAEKVTNLYLVPTLYHDLLQQPGFSREQVASVTKLGFAGAPMTEDLIARLNTAFQPQLFVNHYGSSEIYTFTICQDAAAKPGSAGKAGINERIRVVKLTATDPDSLADNHEEGQIICSLESDEAFSGYWNRPDADQKSLRLGWYFTGDTGYLDDDGDLFVTGRIDDMIISGGENITPVEIESILSLNPKVSEVAVVGLADERLGQRVTAFIKRTGVIDKEELDQWCQSSQLADYKRPRDYVFVTEIPKSPVGKLLRRLLVSGDYQIDES